MTLSFQPDNLNHASYVQTDQTRSIAGDVNIERILLVDYVDRHLTINKLFGDPTIRTKDILPRIQQIDLFYSIFTPTIYCELQCVDAVDDIHDPINGEQYLYLEYKSPYLPPEQTMQMLFRIYKISDIEINEQNRARTYTVYATSPEAIDNAAVKIYRSLRTSTGDSGNQISVIVPEILSNDLKSQKRIDVENTTGIINKYITKLHPLQAIDYLRQIATSANRPTGSFVFFERPTGYVFRTLEDLFETGQKRGPVQSFVFDTVGFSDIDQDLYNRVIAFNQPSFVDNYIKIVSGGISNRVSSFDIITGKFEMLVYDHAKSRQKNKYAEPAERGLNNSNRFFDQFSATNYTKYLVEAATDRQPSIKSKLATQQGYALELAQNIVQISIRGNSSVMIGDVIELNLIIPSAITGEGDNKQETKRASKDSGNYLISRARDTILNGERPQHMQSFELIKGQFLKEPSL